jgi:hypothetical protein
VEIFRSSASRNKNRKDKGLEPLPLDDHIVGLGVQGLGQLSEAALASLAAAADPKNAAVTDATPVADAAPGPASSAASKVAPGGSGGGGATSASDEASASAGQEPGMLPPRAWFAGPPRGEFGCVVDVGSWRPAVQVSEVAHVTIDFRAGPHESAAGAAVVTLEALPLSKAELAQRGGGKFKLVELRSC